MAETPAMEGLGNVLVNVLGPVQLYVYGGKPPAEFADRVRVLPSHNGLLLEGAAVKVGKLFIVSANVLTALLQIPLLAITDTVPEVLPRVTVTELVFKPAVIVHPAGKVQI